MTPLTQALTQARESAAKMHHGQSTDDGCADAMFSFKAGVNWLYAFLQAQAPAFDEKAANNQADIEKNWNFKISNWADFVKGARWQHEQMSARVALAEARYAQAEDELDKTDKVYRMNRQFVEDAKKRIAELSAQVDVSNHNRKIVLLQERVKELEAAVEEVKCLRSVLSEWDADKSCYVQMIRADELAKERHGNL